MARATKRRKQFKLTLPEEVLGHLDERYRRTGVEKQLQVLAGIVALECLSEPMRLTMIQWATQVAQDGASWSALLEAVKKRRGELLDRRRLTDALAELERLAQASAAKRRLG